MAIGGPWTGKPTIFEFYVLPADRSRAFQLFEALLDASGARLMEIQSNDALLAAMLHSYARDVWSEKIVFRDGITTALPSNGARLQQVTSGRGNPGRDRAAAGRRRVAASAERGHCGDGRGSCRTRTF